MSESEQLSELLLRWEELRQQEADATLESICSQTPELLPELERRVAAIQKMEAVLLPSTQTDASQLHGALRSSDQFDSDPVLPVIPDYEVLGVLGRGGMGVVYRARQVKLGRTVAIKMLDHNALTGRRKIERFFDEARAVAKLQHPNIVQIFDFGRVDGSPYFSMEIVEGGNLRDRLTGGPMDIAEAARLIEAIARAIHVVHVEGFAHRDLKPANILLTNDGEPKVSDFGLAKRLDDDSGHTQTGEILGTVGYMAPEQLDSSQGIIGPRTDIYALGTLLYEMLTGKPTFTASPAPALREVLEGEVSLPARARRGLPRDLEAICLKCLEKKADDRYESAEALADDLRRFSEGRPVLARRSGILRRMWKLARRHPVSGYLLIVLLCVVAADLWFSFGRHWNIEALEERAVELAPSAREILQRNCLACHGADPDAIEGKLKVLDHAFLIASDRRYVVPYSPDESRLIQRISDGSMPPEEHEITLPRLAQAELDILYDWILGGAPAFPAREEEAPIEPVVAYSSAAARAKAIFTEHCHECHSYDKAKGGIKILHHRLLLEVRKVVVPGRPDESELFQLLITPNKQARMPPKSMRRLSEENIEAVRVWIAEGAAPFPKTE